MKKENDEFIKKETLQDEFLSDLTHELRTPLALIKGFSQVILEDEDMDEENRKDFLKTIYNESCRLSAMLDKLSEISKLDRKKTFINKKMISPAKFIDNILTDFYPLANKKAISLTCNSSGDIPCVDMDPDKMRLVFKEIINDALKATPENGKIKIKLKFTGKNLIIEIKDNGKGIAPEEIPLIFNKFYRVSAKDEDSAGGTGLGLSLAKRIIEEHRGNIKVKSHITKGTSFLIKLPAV